MKYEQILLNLKVLKDELKELYKKRLYSKNPERIITKLGHFLDTTKPGSEPTLDEIEQAMKDKRKIKSK